MLMDRPGVAAVVLAASLTLTHCASAAEGVFGDWLGLRSRLAALGVDFEVYYVNEFAANVRGGTRKERADADQLYLGGRLNLNRLFGLPGASIVFSLTDRNGDSIATKAGLHTLLEPQEIHGGGSYTRLNQLYWQQDLFVNQLVLKFGRMTGSFDFMPFSCNFQNSTFCATLPAHNVAANWIPFPYSTWAGIARLNGKQDWYIQAGVYQVNPQFTQDRYRFAFGSPFGGPGTRKVMEIGWLPKSAGLNGGYRIGAWSDNFGGGDLYLNTNRGPLATQGGAPLQRHHQFGFYAMAQQLVWSSGCCSNRSVSVFANFVQTDRRISTVGQIAEAGVFWKAPLSLRPQDDLGIAVGRVHVNGLIAQDVALYNAEVASAAALPPLPIPRAEYPTEIYYTVGVTPAIAFRPNIEFIHAPGGVDERSNVLLFGVHLTVQF